MTKHEFETKHLSGWTRRLKKITTEFGDSLTEGEIYHLKKRHVRYLKTWYMKGWGLESRESDYDFIWGLRMSRQSATEVKENKVWGEKYPVVNGMSVGEYIPKIEKYVHKKKKKDVSKKKVKLWSGIDTFNPATDNDWNKGP